MASVTTIAKAVKQPRGGYLKIEQFSNVGLLDFIDLKPTENIHPTITGLVVDYLSRFKSGTPANEAFKISLFGAKKAEKFGMKNAVQIANGYLSQIENLDDNSIINACKLATFDMWFRNAFSAMRATPHTEINPDEDTIFNIRTMVTRSLTFFELYGPVVKDGFTFLPNGYTDIVDSGDGDFLTADTMWDFKVSKKKPNKDHTLQLLMYWVMGQHSGNDDFKNITKIGFFNPRSNEKNVIDVSDIDSDLIKLVEKEIIGY